MENLKKASKVLLFTLTILALSQQHPCRAQNSRKDYLNAHNTARANVGVGAMTWDANVAAFAKNYVNSRLGDCKLTHSSSSYGENLAKGSGNFTALRAIKLWVDEKPYYDYSSNSCIGGTCGHYTQVVWRNSVRLGCARARCNDGWWFISCNYDPPGNYYGQWPYDVPETISSDSYSII